MPQEMAGGLGFEPRLAESESAVLPLDDPPAGARRAVYGARIGLVRRERRTFYHIGFGLCREKSPPPADGAGGPAAARIPLGDGRRGG